MNDQGPKDPPARPSNEPLFWSLFSAGGTITALLLPVLIVLTGFVLPAGEISFTRLEDIFEHPGTRVALVIITALAFFHAAHRLRFTLVDLGLKRFAQPLAVLCYGAALTASGYAVAVVVVDWS